MRNRKRIDSWSIAFFIFAGIAILYAIIFTTSLWASDLPLWMKFFLMRGIWEGQDEVRERSRIWRRDIWTRRGEHANRCPS